MKELGTCESVAHPGFQGNSSPAKGERHIWPCKKMIAEPVEVFHYDGLDKHASLLHLYTILSATRHTQRLQWAVGEVGGDGRTAQPAGQKNFSHFG